MRLSTLAVATLAAAAALGSGCAPLVVGAAFVGGGLSYTDRRTSGAQIEDQSIELKAAARVREAATLGHVNVTSYNRVVLITGEVPGEAEKASVERAVNTVENIKSVVNELAVEGNSPLSSRSGDTVVGTKIKATFVDARDLQANAFKVVVERGVVYLLGRVTEREAKRGIELARSVSGVQKVVPIFDPLSESELASMGRDPATSQPNAPASPSATPAPRGPTR